MIAAILRIGASLDLDTVPREAVEGARAFTGACDRAIYARSFPGQPPRLRHLGSHAGGTRNAGRVAPDEMKVALRR